jgi:hypothetical protein
MIQRSVLLFLAAATIAAVCLTAFVAVGMDSETEAEEESQFLCIDGPSPPELQGPHRDPRGLESTGPSPGAPMNGEPREGMQLGDGRDRRAVQNPSQPDMRMEPFGGQRPEYEHDATPEMMSASLRPMIDGDISDFDPGFVEDVINYAEENGMYEVAEFLMKKLAAYFESYLHVTLHINAIDTRASGLDDDVDEAQDFEVVDDDDEDPEDPMPYGESPISLYKPFSPYSEPRSVILEL